MSKKSQYEILLDQISTEIFSLNTKDKHSIEKIIDSKYVDNFNIYQNNLFYFINDKFQSQLIGSFKHMGKDNFRYFIRKFILDRGISSIIVNEVLLSFTHYIKKSFDIHEDKMLESLINIDLLWNGHGEASTWVIEGSIIYWKSLVEDIELNEVEVDFDQEEKIQRLFIDDQLCMKKISTRKKRDRIEA